MHVLWIFPHLQWITIGPIEESCSLMTLLWNVQDARGVVRHAMVRPDSELKMSHCHRTLDIS